MNTADWASAALGVVVLAGSAVTVWKADALAARTGKVLRRRRRKPKPTTARHRLGGEQTQAIVLPAEIKPGRHVGRAQVRDEQKPAWPTNEDRLERTTRWIKWLPTNAVHMSRWGKR